MKHQFRVGAILTLFIVFFWDAAQAANRAIKRNGHGDEPRLALVVQTN